jgi:hypothetical protein
VGECFLELAWFGRGSEGVNGEEARGENLEEKREKKRRGEKM